MRAPPSETLTCNLELQSVSGCQSALTSDADGCLPAELELQELEELHGRSFSVISSGDSDEDSSADTVSNRGRLSMQRSYGADSSLVCAQAMTSSQDSSSFSEDSSDGSDLSAEESEDEGDDDDDDDEEEEEGGESRSSDGDGAASPTTDSYDGLSSSDLV